MQEYPKRLYKNGRGYTVHSIEEEAQFYATVSEFNKLNREQGIAEQLSTEELPDEVSPVQKEVKKHEEKKHTEKHDDKKHEEKHESKYDDKKHTEHKKK